jgi:hypothetical protein
LRSIGGFVRHITAIALTSLALGCGGNKYEYAGYQTHKYFPLDGETRHWEYYSEDATYLLRVDMLSPQELLGSTSIATLEYTQISPHKLLWTVKWSSDSSSGIQIHGYMLEDTGGDPDPGDDTGDAGGDTGGTAVDAEVGTWVSFDPPVQLSEYQMAPGDSVQTTSGGVTYTSTLVESKQCPNNWVTKPWDCLVFQLEGDDEAPFVGTWELATDWGVSRFQPASKSGTPWVLTDAGIEWEE